MRTPPGNLTAIDETDRRVHGWTVYAQSMCVTTACPRVMTPHHTIPLQRTERAYAIVPTTSARLSFFPSVRSTNLRTLRCVCSNADRVDASSRPRDDHRDGSRRSIAPRRDASVERVRDDARNRTDRTRGVCPVGARERDVETGRARTTRERVARGSREKICAVRRRRARRDARTGGGETTGRRERA